MSRARPKLSVVVPCHNSAFFIVKNVKRIISELTFEDECILVENGSSDNTWSILKESFTQDTYPNVVLKQSSKGLGAALKIGIAESTGDKIVFMADDLPFGLQEIRIARSTNLTNKHVIISKYLGNIHISFKRRFFGILFIYLREALFKTGIKDSQATFMGDGNKLKAIAMQCQEKGFLITLELILIAKKLKVSVVEIPCDEFSKPVRKTTIKFKDSIKTLFSMFILRMRLR